MIDTLLSDTRSLNRTQMQTLLEVDSDKLTEALHEGLVPKPHYYMLKIHPRWRRSRLLSWYYDGGYSAFKHWQGECGYVRNAG
jgi:hypothetical protein